MSTTPLLRRSSAEEFSLRNRHKVASIWLKDAVHCRFSYPITSSAVLSSYSFLHGSFFLFLRKTSVFIALFLPFVESSQSCLPQYFELFMCITFLVESLLRLRVMGSKAFTKDFWCFTKILFLPLTLADLTLTLFSKNGLVEENRFLKYRPLRIVRNFYILESNRMLRVNSQFKLLLFPKLVEILLILSVLIIVYALIARITFPVGHGLVQSRETQSFLDLCITLFITSTSVIFPDIAVPTLSDGAGLFIYYVTFLLLAMYYVSNLFLSNVFHGYKLFLKSDYKLKMRVQKQSCAKSFRLICDENELLEFAEFLELVSAAYPVMEDATIEEMFVNLSKSRSVLSALTGEEFSMICRYIRFELKSFEKERISRVLYYFSTECMAFLMKFRPFSAISTMCHRITENILFWFVMKFFVFANAIFLYFQVENVVNFTNFWVATNYFFACLFLLEFCIDLISDGLFGLRQNAFLLLQCISSVSLFLCVCVFGAASSSVAILRSVMCIRLIFIIAHVEVTVRITLRMITHFMVNILSIVLVLYTYAFLGMYIFGELLVATNPALQDSLYGVSDYYGINFDSFGNSLFLLFHLLVVNNWHITMSGAVAVTSKWARVFFISYYVVVVLVLFNVIIALFVEIFSSQLDYLKRIEVNGAGDIPEVEEVVDQSVMEWKISGGLRRRRKDAGAVSAEFKRLSSSKRWLSEYEKVEQC